MTTVQTTNNVAEANVITHGGIFHGDDIFATVILAEIFDTPLKVYRTFSVPEDLPENVIVYDIGGGKFDHHQRGGNGMRDNGVPYSSVGLLWKEYGHKLLGSYCFPELTEIVWSIIDHDLIQGLDAMDNGTMPQAEYPAQVLNVYKIIFDFNPTWDDEETDTEAAFLQAVSFAEQIFDNVLAHALSKATAKTIVEKSIEASDGQIMTLEQYVPWEDFIFTSENPKASDIQFVIFPSNRGGYNWQCVPDAPGSFGQRKPVPSIWKGLRDTELQKITGVKTAIFCHPAGFMGAAETVEDAILMAKLALEA